jgi:hypothetical protein
MPIAVHERRSPPLQGCRQHLLRLVRELLKLQNWHILVFDEGGLLLNGI